MTTNNKEQKTYIFQTFGCKLNFAESSTIAHQLEKMNYRRATPEDLEVDLCVVNTCSVTDHADKKCRQTLHKLRRKYPSTYLVATGCYAQLQPEEIKTLDCVDLILGANDKFSLSTLLQEENPSSKVSSTVKPTPFYGAYSKEDRTRHFLKVQDGCDYFCTYCTIPIARGRSRNGKISDLVQQANQIANEGGKEIILSGVNIGDFGKTTGEQLIDLLLALDKVEGISRFRISSIEPNLLTEEIINFVANSKRFAPHFHIPLQAGSDHVLQLMKRKYTTALFTERIQLIKKLLPDAFIGVDVIVGTRGETLIDFEESYALIKSLAISQLHVFSYSERAGTAALQIPNPVDPREKKRRSNLLLELSEQKLKHFCSTQIGTTRNILWESAKKGKLMEGFSENYIRIKKEFDPKSINQFEQIRVEAASLAYD